jgi:hypothetical protein
MSRHLVAERRQIDAKLRPTMTLGEERVRVVDQLKQKTAELINLCDARSNGKGPEEKRLWALAMAHYEDAAMWAVKAATTGK